MGEHGSAQMLDLSLDSVTGFSIRQTCADVNEGRVKEAFQIGARLLLSLPDTVLMLGKGKDAPGINCPLCGEKLGRTLRELRGIGRDSVPDDLLRLSVGIENVKDLLQDLMPALAIDCIDAIETVI